MLIPSIIDDCSAAEKGDYAEKGWPTSTMSAYEVSKVALCALTRIQQRQFDHDNERPDILVNSVHPGYVDTDMTKHTGHLTIEQGNCRRISLTSFKKYCFPWFNAHRCFSSVLAGSSPA